MNEARAMCDTLNLLQNNSQPIDKSAQKESHTSGSDRDNYWHGTTSWEPSHVNQTPETGNLFNFPYIDKISVICLTETLFLWILNWSYYTFIIFIFCK